MNAKSLFFSLCAAPKCGLLRFTTLPFTFLLLSVAPCKMQGPWQGNAMADPSLHLLASMESGI